MSDYRIDDMLKTEKELRNDWELTKQILSLWWTRTIALDLFREYHEEDWAWMLKDVNTPMAASANYRTSKTTKMDDHTPILWELEVSGQLAYPTIYEYKNPKFCVSVEFCEAPPKRVLHRIPDNGIERHTLIHEIVNDLQCVLTNIQQNLLNWHGVNIHVDTKEIASRLQREYARAYIGHGIYETLAYWENNPRKQLDDLIKWYREINMPLPRVTEN